MQRDNNKLATLLPILLAEFHDRLDESRQSYKRHITFPQADNKIKVAIGMRRVGKTTFVMQTINELLNQGDIHLDQILYLNLEDDRLLPYSQTRLRELIEAFYSLYPQNHDRVCYLFLDEIQNIDEWAVLVRRIFDSKKVQIYLSGSSAKLLSKEIHTSLRGRALSTEIWPYDFVEYMQTLQIRFSNKLKSQKNQDYLLQHLKLYLKEGGFPETLKMPTELRRQTLQDYVDVVIMRDIVERYSITNLVLIKYMIKSLLKNTSSIFSINKFYNDLKSQGISGAKNTLHDYLGYIEDAYLIFPTPLYSESLRKSQTSPRKVYAIDPGLVNAYSYGLNKNYGHYFENMIYLDLRRKGYKVYYYVTMQRYEIDFFAIDPTGKAKLLQVVWDVSDKDTLQREQRALEDAERELGIKGELITPSSYFDSHWDKLVTLDK